MIESRSPFGGAVRPDEAAVHHGPGPFGDIVVPEGATITPALIAALERPDRPIGFYEAVRALIAAVSHLEQQVMALTGDVPERSGSRAQPDAQG